MADNNKWVSTGLSIIHIRVSKSTTGSQNSHWLRSQNVMLHCFGVWRIDIIARIKSERIRARMPPTLLVIDYRFVQANSEYHSWLMCGECSWTWLEHSYLMSQEVR